MANVPDLISLLCLDPKFSRSPFGGQHRTLFVSKDYTNAGDFVFQNLLQHFARREPDAKILLIAANQNWNHYSASSAKSGFNLRRSQNGGNIDVVDVMSVYLELVRTGRHDGLEPHDYILGVVNDFLKLFYSKDNAEDYYNCKPPIVLIDDLSTLTSLGSEMEDMYLLISVIDGTMRHFSRFLPQKSSYLILQTMELVVPRNLSFLNPDETLNRLIENSCDIVITLRPLDTGHSTRVDGTIKIVDNRLKANSQDTAASQPTTSLFPERSGEIGTTKVYFFKVGDRRVRLFSSAYIS